MVKNLSLLGSTGSIGTQALSVVYNLGINVVSLTANKNIGRRHSPAFRILFFALMIIFALPAFFGCTAANASAPIEKLSDALRKEGTLPHDANAFTEGLFFHKYHY